MSEPFDKLAAQLSKLFELEKADLDFGIHRIIKARQKHIRVFLGLDQAPADDPGAPSLKKIVQREMGELNTVELERQLDATAEKIKTDYGKLAFTDGNLADGPAKDSGDGQLWMTLKEELNSGEDKANAQLEAEIYSHLTEFFSRYYDEADFLSKRRIKAGDAPYAVPYSGEEVMLHWANKDQFYIKSSKDLKDYTFTLPEQFGGKRVQFKCERQDPVLNNNNAKREFHLDLDEDGTPQITTCRDADGKEALVIGFHFKIVDKTRTAPETKAWIEHLLELLPGNDWRAALSHTPEGAKSNLITRHLHNYTRKNEADFFIHKQLGHFLRGELDFYIKNEVMHLDDIDEKSTDYLTTRVRLIKALRTIARHIIRFLAQLENFQKKLWLKKKYVTETQYCFTLDRVMALGERGQVLLDTLLRHVDDKIRRYDGEMRSQHDEWIKLYAIDELEDYPEDGKLTAAFLKAHDKLMLDTVFYLPGFKWQLLGAMDDLEEQLDGLLIHSENFQALRLIGQAHQKSIDVVFIDPPYNTGLGDFPYKDRYRHSSWISSLYEVVSLSSQLMHDSSSLWVTLDENESGNLKSVLAHGSSDLHFISDIAWEKVYSPRMDAKQFSASYDHLLVFATNETWSPNNRAIEPDESQFPHTAPDGRKYRSDPLRKWGKNSLRADRPNLWFPIKSPCGLDVWPIKPDGTEGCWRWQGSTVETRFNELDWIDKGNGLQPYVRQYADNSNWRPVETIWNWEIGGSTHEAKEELKAILGNENFSTPKPSKLILETYSAGVRNNRTILDFYAGSGTTGHAMIKSIRESQNAQRYVLVEMGDYFDGVLLPRLKRSVYTSKWRDGKPTAPDTGISHGFKYLRLESYEDALNNLDLGEDRAPDLLGLGDQVREDFLFSYLLDVETRGHLLNLEHFRDPWGCQLKIHDPHTGCGEARVVDLVETFHYLLGVTVREIRVQGTKEKPDAFLTIEGESPDGQAILIIWRRLEANPDVHERNRIDWPVTDNKDLKAFAATNRGTARGLNPADTEFHAIYLNGDHTLADPNSKIHCIEEVFYERMFANTGNPED